MGKVRDLSSAPSARGWSAEHELCLRAERQATRIARHWVMRALASAGVGGTLNQVTEVLAGELVTATVRRCDPDGEVRVGLRVNPGSVHVWVTGPSPLVPAPANDASLALVEVLSSAWGSRREHDGRRTVWFDVDTAG